MRKLIWPKWGLVIMLIFLISIFYSQIAESKIVKTNLKTILSDVNLIALMKYWDIKDNEFLCIVKSHKKVGYEIRKLIIYKKSENYFHKIYENETDDGFSDFSIINNHLMVTWIGGSAFHYNIYAIKESTASLVLEVGSHNSPEIADIDNDGEGEILISEGAFLSSDGKITQYPEETSIYKWDGKKYKLLKKVDWKDRFYSKQ